MLIKEMQTEINENTSDEISEETETVEEENIDTFVRPETTGKATQWGDVDEVIRISKEFDKVLPCIDFSHLYARTVGENNTYDDFCRIIEKIGNELGEYALNNFHAHIEHCPNHIEISFDRDGNDWSKNCLIRGGEEYNPPYGWTGFALKVLNKFDNGDNRIDFNFVFVLLSCCCDAFHY